MHDFNGRVRRSASKITDRRWKRALAANPASENLVRL
jgi:hypothetical protein